MDLTPYVSNLRSELAVAAETGGPQARDLAERLTAPLESAVRLTLLDALTTAADEITRDLAPGSVELRLRGREPSFVVTTPPTYAEAEPQPAAPAPAPVTDLGLDGDDGAMARINVRLPEALKARIEEAAGAEKISANAWLVRAATLVLSGADTAQSGASFTAPNATAPRRTPPKKQSFTGWVR
jgi:hypothetical protein